jgi:hypothetical protein
MSAQQVQRLQTLLETVQRNRQRPGEPISAASANVVQKKAPANTTAEPSRPRVPTPDLAAAPPLPTPGSLRHRRKRPHPKLLLRPNPSQLLHLSRHRWPKLQSRSSRG